MILVAGMVSAAVTDALTEKIYDVSTAAVVVGGLYASPQPILALATGVVTLLVAVQLADRDMIGHGDAGLIAAGALAAVPDAAVFLAVLVPVGTGWVLLQDRLFDDWQAYAPAVLLAYIAPALIL